RSTLLIVVGLVYLLGLAATLTGLVHIGDAWLLGLVPAGVVSSALLFYALVAGRLFRQTLIKPDGSARWVAFLRVTHMTLVLTSLAWLSHLTGKPWGLYYIVLWVVPMVTTFSFFMILRQVVQHGNADRDRLTNTRVFHVGRLIQFAVFPLGM